MRSESYDGSAYVGLGNMAAFSDHEGWGGIKTSPATRSIWFCHIWNGSIGLADRCGKPQRGDSSRPIPVDRSINGQNLDQICVGPDSACVLSCPSLVTPGPHVSGREGTPKPLLAPNPHPTSLPSPLVAPPYAVGAAVAAAKSRRILLASSHVLVSPYSTAATVCRPDAWVRC
jgi:hypothetical protein